MTKRGFTALLILLTLLLVLAGCGLPGGAGLPPAGRACTSFCLDNGGQAVFGTNYENEIWEGLLFVNKRGVTKTGWEPSTAGTYARWTSRHGSVTFNLAGVLYLCAPGRTSAGGHQAAHPAPGGLGRPDRRPPPMAHGPPPGSRHRRPGGVAGPSLSLTPQDCIRKTLWCRGEC